MTTITDETMYYIEYHDSVLDRWLCLREGPWQTLNGATEFGASECGFAYRVTTEPNCEDCDHEPGATRELIAKGSRGYLIGSHGEGVTALNTEDAPSGRILVRNATGDRCTVDVNEVEWL